MCTVTFLIHLDNCLTHDVSVEQGKMRSYSTSLSRCKTSWSCRFDAVSLMSRLDPRYLTALCRQISAASRSAEVVELQKVLKKKEEFIAEIMQEGTCSSWWYCSGYVDCW